MTVQDATLSVDSFPLRAVSPRTSPWSVPTSQPIDIITTNDRTAA